MYTLTITRDRDIVTYRLNTFADVEDTMRAYAPDFDVVEMKAIFNYNGACIATYHRK